LKSSKYAFGADHISFSGHLVSKEGIRPDPDKLKAMTALPEPKDASGVRRVLGAFGYYRKFIWNFSALAEPLIKLTRKNAPFQWGAEQAEEDQEYLGAK